MKLQSELLTVRISVLCEQMSCPDKYHKLESFDNLSVIFCAMEIL